MVKTIKACDCIIVSDIDGTFLGKDSRIVERNIRAIKKLEELGGHFTFATGRTNANILSVIPMAAEIANVPAIMANGAYLYDFFSENVVLPSYMDYDVTCRIAEYVKEKYPKIGVRLSTPDMFYFEKLEGPIERDMSRVSPEKYDILPIEKWKRDGWVKLVFRGDADTLDRIRLEVREKFGDVIEACKSNARYLEYQNAGCSKATALGKLRKYCDGKGIGKGELTVIACGDFENDYDMLKSADISVCPSNALESVKQICDFCLCDHDDGLIADIAEKVLGIAGI